MATKAIVLYPDPQLRQVCEPVKEITDEVRQLLADMAETMYQKSGIGLAANQVGRNIRAVVVDLGADEESGREASLYQVINPTIVASVGSVESEEGCLSIPGIREVIPRHAQVTVTGLDSDGREITIEADGLLAICFQHEIDHLNGVLFIDHLSRLKRELAKSRYKKLSQKG